MASRIPTTTPSLHERLLLNLLDENPQAKRRGFMAAIRDEIPDAVTEGERLGAVPDAFLIDHEINCVAIFEVEVTNPVSYTKMVNYGNLWWGLDYYGWKFFVIKIRPDNVVMVDMAGWVLEDLEKYRLRAAAAVLE